MADNGKSIPLVILGIVAVLAIVGLVMMLNSSSTGKVVAMSPAANCQSQCIGRGLDPIADASSGAWGSCMIQCSNELRDLQSGRRG